MISVRRNYVYGRRRARAAAMSLAAALLLIGGCSRVNPLPQLPFEWAPPEEKQIASLMQWHSGRVEVYRDFTTVFTARAVYLSDAVREMALDWEARTRILDPEEKKALSDRIYRSDKGEMEFLLALYTPEEEDNRLEDENATLKVYMRRPDGRRIRAACLEAGDEERKIYMRFLQWDLSWSKLYRVCFKEDPATAVEDGVVTLLLTGPAGQGEMVLKAAPPPGQAP